MPKDLKDKKQSKMLRALTIKEPEGGSPRESVGRRLPSTPFPSFIAEASGSSSDSYIPPKKRIVRRATPAPFGKKINENKEYAPKSGKDLYEFYAARNRVMNNYVHPALPAVPSTNIRQSN